MISYLKPQDVLRQPDSACAACPVPFGGVDVPASVHSDMTDFTFFLKPIGTVQGPAMVQCGITPQESKMGPSVVCTVTRAMAKIT